MHICKHGMHPIDTVHSVESCHLPKLATQGRQLGPGVRGQAEDQRSANRTKARMFVHRTHIYAHTSWALYFFFFPIIVGWVCRQLVGWRDVFHGNSTTHLTWFNPPTTPNMHQIWGDPTHDPVHSDVRTPSSNQHYQANRILPQSCLEWVGGCHKCVKKRFE